MRGAGPLLVAALLAALLLAPAATGGDGGLEAAPVRSLRVGFPLASIRTADVDGDGAADLVVVGDAGEVRVHGLAAEGGDLVARGKEPIRLADPARTVLAIGDLVGAGRPQLVTLSPRGVAVHAASEAGAFAVDATRLIRSARFPFRVGTPHFVDLLSDVNRDGRLDVVTPRIGAWDLWLAEGPDGDGPAFRRTASVRTDIRYERKAEATRLSDTLESGFSVPAVRLTDVNGDGRLDLVVVGKHARAFHLQREDGSIPADPDVSLDLELFRDTTAEAEIRPGRTLAGDDDAKLRIDDLDLDGIPDYLIYHRRKLWIFHGTPEGPQFRRPTTILKTAEDITALLVLPLDDDGRPDLLLVRVQVPTVAAILNGLYSELDVEISATGYAGEEGRTFGRTPRWRGKLVLRLPEIMGVLRNPGALLRKFEETTSKFRPSAEGDLDGDGKPDLAMVSEDGRSLEVWRGVVEEGVARDVTGLRSLFFEQEDRAWDLDRVLGWLGDVAERRARSLTQGRDPDLTIGLRDPDRFDRAALLLADVDGDGREEVVLAWRDAEAGGEGVVDVHGVR